MFILTASLVQYLLINAIFACVALAVGFAAGAYLAGAKLAKSSRQSQNKPSKALASKPPYAAEIAAKVANRVRDVAQTVASDVGHHTDKIKAISADLAGIDRQSAAANSAVFAALDQMLSANTELQQRLQKAEQQLVAQAAEIRAHETDARTDALTGLANRRAFDQELKRRLSEWQRKNTPCTLVLLDIDHFKNFNDTHGHTIGDAVLQNIAQVLKSQSRDMDLPCRYGGEEFGIILPSTEIAAACRVAERIRAAVEASSTVADGKTLQVTCSIGVAQFNSTDDAAKLIRRADKGLYVSKKSGRNCGHWHNGESCLPIAETVAIILPSDAPADIPEVADTPVTPGGSRGSFIHLLKRRVTESHRFGIPIAVIYMRLDEFDIIRQKYGAAFGRRILDVAEPSLTKPLREMDVLVRLDHGQFVVMLPGSTEKDAMRMVKRMRSITSQCVLPLVDRELALRFHFGIAQLKSSETAKELFNRAKQKAFVESVQTE